MAFKTKVVLVVLLAALLIGVPPGLGQQPPADNRGNLYSIWLKLSMMGHNQSEIEGILTGITPLSRLLQSLTQRLIHQTKHDLLLYQTLPNDILQEKQGNRSTEVLRLFMDVFAHPPFYAPRG